MTTPRRPAYVAIARRFFETDPLWMERRSFSRAEAWLDLVQRACFVEQDWAVPGGAVIRLARGETPPLSHSYLARRWGWSIKQVRRALGWFCRADRIGQGQGTPQGHTYFLVNYELYQGGGQSGGQAEGMPEGSPRAGRGQESEAGESGESGNRGTAPPPTSVQPPIPAPPTGELELMPPGERTHPAPSPNGGRQPRRSRAGTQKLPAASQPSPPWSDRVIDTWRACAGEPAAGPLLKALKPVHDQLERENAATATARLCYGLAKWLRAGKGDYGPYVFGRNWRRWIPGGEEGLPSSTDLELTEFIGGDVPSA